MLNCVFKLEMREKIVPKIIYESEFEKLCAESADEPWFDPLNETWRNTGPTCAASSLNAPCKYFAHQKNFCGDVVVTHCSHPENTDPCEGNNTLELCPLKDSLE